MAEQDKCEVYLRYLPRSADEAAIRELLSKCGEIKRVWVSKEKATGECKGFAFVNFAKRKDARNCVMHYNEHPKNYLDGKHVVFEHAKAWEGNVEKKPAACSYGIDCQKEDCYFSHPAGWAFEKKSTGGKGGGSKTGGSGGDGKGNSSAGGTRDGKVRKKVRSKSRLGAKARQRAKKRAAKEEAEKAG